jgi:tetrahydromethanopterin S-methyltransferase subunit C
MKSTVAILGTLGAVLIGIGGAALLPPVAAYGLGMAVASGLCAILARLDK